MITKIISFTLIPSITLLLIWALGWLWFAMSVATTTSFNKDTPPHPIIVLTGGNGRINAALDLMVKTKSKDLLISGVNKHVTQSDILKTWKNAPSSIPCCIELGYKSTDTITNAVEVKEWVEDKKIESFYLVTSNYHMPRAYMEIQKILPTTNILRYPVTSNDVEPWKNRFWKLTFSEYNKSIIRWMKNVTI